MYCKSCGAPLPDGAKFCQTCGAKCEDGQQAFAGAQAPAAPAYVPPTVGATQPLAGQQAPVVGMKWYKFLIYFSLWAGAVLTCINAITVLTGAQYNSTGGSGAADLVYMIFPRLKTYDMMYGIAMLLYAVFMIYTRSRLAKFCANGPLYVNVCYSLRIVMDVLYVIAAGSVLGQSVMNATIVSSLIVSALIVCINYVYFKKRKYMFVN